MTVNDDPALSPHGSVKYLPEPIGLELDLGTRALYWTKDTRIGQN
jgi:hypothetical protein